MTRAHYMSKRANYSLRLRSPTKTIVNGVKYTEPGLRANFHEHNFVTDKQEVIKILDEMLTGREGHLWQRKFYKVPSQDVIQKVADTQKKIRAMEQDELNRSMTKKQREEFEGWKTFLARQKMKEPPIVQGTRARKKEEAPKEETPHEQPV